MLDVRAACLQFFNLASRQSREKIFLLFVSSFVYITSAHALESFNKIPRRWQLEAGHYGFHTIGNFDDAGRQQPLPPSSMYQGFYGYTSLTYDVTDYWSVGLTGDGGLTHSLSGATDRTSTFLNSGQFDTMLLWRTRVLWIAPEYRATVPFFRNDLATQDTLVGEGAVEHKGLIHFFKPWTRVAQSFAFIGYTYRDEGRSHLIPYGAGMRFRAKPIWFGAKFDGARTAMSDGFTNQARMRHDVLRRVNASSYKYFSINPEWTRVEGFVDWVPSRNFSVRVGINTTVMGFNYAQEFGWNAALTYTFGEHIEDPKAISLLNAEEAKKKRQKQLDRHFKMKLEKEDPSLFHEEEELP